MKVYKVIDRTDLIVGNLVDIWEKSVKSTHKFLSLNEINMIKKYVPHAIEQVESLIVCENDEGEIIGFMGIENKRLEMLFLNPKNIGQGIGRRLLEYGIKNYAVNELTVNEQNPKAVEFYEHMGFKTYKRTENDEQGNPYPILYMKLDGHL